MGNSRKPSPSDLPERVAATLAPAISPGAHLVLGLSGGVDSVALLVALAELAPGLRFSLRAVHVNHGISPNAANWAAFCSGLCARLAIPLQVETVDIAPFRDLGLEAAARKARYEAFSRIDADFLLLAQHRDDQAETLLLRLLRGTGLKGLAAMAPVRPLEGTRVSILRPLLGTSRAEIEAFARARGLEWVEDESNADTARQRNFLRHDVIPVLERQFREARELLDAMARADLERCLGGTAVDVPALLRLGEARAKNVLRYWCDMHDLEPLPASRLAELLRQLKESRHDSRT